MQRISRWAGTNIHILVAHSGLLISAYSHQSGETPHGCLYSVCWLKASRLAGSGFWRVKLSQLPALVFKFFLLMDFWTRAKPRNLCLQDGLVFFETHTDTLSQLPVDSAERVHLTQFAVSTIRLFFNLLCDDAKKPALLGMRITEVKMWWRGTIGAKIFITAAGFF